MPRGRLFKKSHNAHQLIRKKRSYEDLSMGPVPLKRESAENHEDGETFYPEFQTLGENNDGLVVDRNAWNDFQKMADAFGLSK